MNINLRCLSFLLESESYKPSNLSHKWRNVVFETTLLEGHNDMVCAVDTDGTIAVTGRYFCFYVVYRFINESVLTRLIMKVYLCNRNLCNTN